MPGVNPKHRPQYWLHWDTTSLVEPPFAGNLMLMLCLLFVVDNEAFPYCSVHTLIFINAFCRQA